MNKKEITEILNSLNWLFEAHDSYVELVELKGNKVVISGSGQCITCDSNCVEEAIKARFPDIKVIFR